MTALQTVMLRPDLSDDERLALGAVRDLMQYRAELTQYAKRRRAIALIKREWGGFVIWLGAIVGAWATFKDEIIAALKWMIERLGE